MGIAALLVAAELLLRSPVARTRVLLPTHHYQDGVALRQLALEKVLREEGRLDLLLLGSSVARTNLRPLLLDEVLREGRPGAAAEPEIVSFNGGLSGLMPDAVGLYLERFWLPRAQPRMVVQGIRYAELADPRAATDQERLMDGRIEPLWLSDRPADRARASAIERLRLLQYQGWLTAVLDRRRGGREIDARGFTPTGLTLEAALEAGLLEPPERYTGEESFARGLEAIRRTHALSASRGVRYVLLNMPEHPDRYPREGGEALYRAYLDTLRELARQEGFDFVDPTDGDLRAFDQEGAFSDYHHMTPEGAARLTRAIAGPIGALLAETDGAAR